ncbi:MAG: flagellar hook-basal body complex protein FliE [Tepidisphaeraceae bacterium]
MTNGVNNLSSQLLRSQDLSKGASNDAKVGTSGTSFADTFKQYLGEVNQLQQQASSAVQDLTTGKTDDLAGVTSAMEKSDVAFKTLVAIRSKLMSAYDELRNMPI